jgi:hypothetical protein
VTLGHTRDVLRGLVVVTVLTLLTGCATFESGASWDIKLRNDTSRTVSVKNCTTSACDRFRYVKRLPAHTTVKALDHGDGTSWWLVLTPKGARLGCLSLGMSKRVDGYVLDVSTLSTCSAEHSARGTLANARADE